MTNNNQGGVVISNNPVKVREMIDKYGNVIDPNTKQVIAPNTEDKAEQGENK